MFTRLCVLCGKYLYSVRSTKSSSDSSDAFRVYHSLMILACSALECSMMALCMLAGNRTGSVDFPRLLSIRVCEKFENCVRTHAGGRIKVQADFRKQTSSQRTIKKMLFDTLLHTSISRMWSLTMYGSNSDKDRSDGPLPKCMSTNSICTECIWWKSIVNLHFIISYILNFVYVYFTSIWRSSYIDCNSGPTTSSKTRRSSRKSVRRNEIEAQKNACAN